MFTQKQKVKKTKVVSFGPTEYMSKELPQLTKSNDSDFFDAW